jgi:hypothetical protein
MQSVKFDVVIEQNSVFKEDSSSAGGEMLIIMKFFALHSCNKTLCG